MWIRSVGTDHIQNYIVCVWIVDLQVITVNFWLGFKTVGSTNVNHGILRSIYICSSEIIQILIKRGGGQETWKSVRHWQSQGVTLGSLSLPVQLISISCTFRGKWQNNRLASPPFGLVDPPLGHCEPFLLPDGPCHSPPPESFLDLSWNLVSKNNCILSF